MPDVTLSGAKGHFGTTLKDIIALFHRMVKCKKKKKPHKKTRCTVKLWWKNILGWWGSKWTNGFAWKQTLEIHFIPSVVPPFLQSVRPVCPPGWGCNHGCACKLCKHILIQAPAAGGQAQWSSGRWIYSLNLGYTCRSRQGNANHSEGRVVLP